MAKKTKLPSISIRDLQTKNELKLGSNVDIPGLVAAMLGECIERMRISESALGLSPGTMKKFTHPAGTETLRIRSVLAVILAIGATPKDFFEYGLCDEAYDVLDQSLKQILRRYRISEYDPESHFARSFGDKGTATLDVIAAAAKRRLVNDEPARPTPHAPFEPSPEKLAILDLIAVGTLLPQRHIDPGFVQQQVAKKFPNLDLPQIDNLLECIAKHGLVDCHNGAYFVRRVETDFWRKITEYRKGMESLNVQFLLEEKDHEVRSKTIAQIGGWMNAMRSALNENNVAAFFYADIRFHQALASHFTPAYHGLSSLLYFIRNAAPFLKSVETMRQLCEDHQQIFDCILPAANENLPRHELEQIKTQAHTLIVKHLDNACSLFGRAAN